MDTVLSVKSSSRMLGALRLARMVLDVETAVLGPADGRRQSVAGSGGAVWPPARRSSCARTSENDRKPQAAPANREQRAIGAERPAERLRASGEGFARHRR